MRQRRAGQRRDDALRDGAGNRDAADREQLLDVKLQADAEHQQDDADFGELFGQRRVGDETGRVRPDQRAGEQISGDRRQAEPMRDVAEREGGGQAAGQRENQVVGMHQEGYGYLMSRRSVAIPTLSTTVRRSSAGVLR